jgi:outer membrane protein TolC
MPAAFGQCAGEVSTPSRAADCTAGSTPPAGVISIIDPNHPYTVAELIDIAEHNNPRTRIAWERAKQKADQLGIERSAYYPILAGVATFATERIIEPFPKPLAPQGYTVDDIPIVQPEITLQYLLFDSGKRKANVDAATAETLFAGANFIQTNQEVAFQVASAYYKLLTAQERLQATKDTLKTAQTTQDAAEAQLHNGRSTLPDVLNARAETSQPSSTSSRRTGTNGLLESSFETRLAWSLLRTSGLILRTRSLCLNYSLCRLKSLSTGRWRTARICWHKSPKYARRTLGSRPPRRNTALG